MERKLTEQSGQKGFIREHLWQLALITALGILIMLPRLLSAQYGMLDDGNSFKAWRAISDGTWGLDYDAGSGRLRPFYWLFSGFLTYLFPDSPAGGFAVNTFILVASCWLLFWTGLLLFRDYRPALLGSVFYILSGPIIETFYTFGKAEHLQVLFGLFSIFIIVSSDKMRSRYLKWVLYLAALFFILLGMLTKETSLILLPISLSWLGAAFILQRWYPELKTQLKIRVIYAVLAAVSGSVFWFTRSSILSAPVRSDQYAGKFLISPDRIMESGIRLAGWFLRDFPHLLPWIIGLFLIFVVRRKINNFPAVIDVFIWTLGWFGIFLPWGSTQEYYLLPFASGVALLSGWLLWRLVVENKFLPVGIRYANLFLLALSGPLFIVTQLHNYTSARTQLIVDRENAKMIEFLVSEAPANGIVYYNFPYGIEYGVELGRHIRDIYHRPDIEVDAFRFQTASGGSRTELEYFVPSPEIRNRIRLSVRIGVGEAFNDRRNALLDFANGHEENVYSSRDSFRVFHLDVFMMACPLFPEELYCNAGTPLMDRGIFTYGWDIDKIVSVAEDQARPSLFQSGRWELRGIDGSMSVIAFGQDGDIPIPADFSGDGFTDLAVYRPGEGLLLADSDYDGEEDLRIMLPQIEDGVVLTGDWRGVEVDEVAVLHLESGLLYSYSGEILLNLDPLIPDNNLRTIPIVGDWDGNGSDEIGYYFPDTGKVDLGIVVLDVPVESRVVVADWAGYGKDTIATYVDGVWNWKMINSHCGSCNSAPSLEYGVGGEIPVAGRWR